MSKLIDVEDVVERSGHVDEAADFSGSARVMHLPYVKKVLAEDRHAIHTLLREATLKFRNITSPLSEEEFDRGYVTAIDDILTLIDGVFSDKTDTK